MLLKKVGSECKVGRDRLTPYQSEDHSPTIPTHRMKKEKGKTIGDKKGASSYIGNGSDHRALLTKTIPQRC